MLNDAYLRGRKKELQDKGHVTIKLLDGADKFWAFTWIMRLCLSSVEKLPSAVSLSLMAEIATVKTKYGMSKAINHCMKEWMKAYERPEYVRLQGSLLDCLWVAHAFGWKDYEEEFVARAAMCIHRPVDLQNRLKSKYALPASTFGKTCSWCL